MRTPLLLLSLLCCTLPCLGQDDSETVRAPRALPADPGAAQDAEAAREKLLKAADQIDMIQSNAETNKVALDGMKSDIAQLQTTNADLKQQIAALQAAFDKAEAAHTRERQALVDEVAQLVATRSASASHTPARHHDSSPEVASSSESTPSDATGIEVHHAAPPVHTATPHPASPDSPADPAPAPRPQKGYYYVVKGGETLTMICAAYRDQGVKVTLAQVRKANGLSSKSVLKVGQKLFIPKPGA